MSENVELTIRQMLNKLSHSNFDDVLQDFKNIQVDDVNHLASLVVNIMITKVDKNPIRASVFARLISKCYRPKFDLRKPILTRCETEFKLCVENMDKVKKSGRNKSLIVGNIHLLGELYNFHALKHKIIIECIDLLLKRHDDLSVTMLCDLIKTIGLKLDKTVKEFTEHQPKTGSLSRLNINMETVQGVENLFETLRTRIHSGSLSLNSITALEEILQLRRNNWKMGEVLQTTPKLRSNLNVENDGGVELTIRQIFNKLNHSNFDKVLKDFTSIQVYDMDAMISLVVEIMISKVVKKPDSAGVFAKLVSKTDGSSKLRKGILPRCQIEFQSILADVDKIKESEDNLFGDVDSEKSKCIKRSAGHIRLIGELYNYSMLGQNTMVGCVNDLLKRHDDLSVTILCILIKTIGPKLDNRIQQFKTAGQTKLNLLDFKENAEFVQWIDTLFQDLDARITGGFLSQNSETGVQEILQLRENNWQADEVLSASKSGDNINLNQANGVNSVPIFESRKVDNEVNKNFVRLNNNKLESSSISKCSSRMSMSSDSTSEALDEDDSVSKRFADLTLFSLVTKKKTRGKRGKRGGKKTFDLMKAQLEKPTDTISSSSGESNMIRGGTNANPTTSRSANSIENKSEIGQSSFSSSPPQLKYLSMYTNYDRMLKQMPPEVVEDINMEISTLIYQRFRHQKELESFSASQNDFENDLFTMI